jgi:hypothetical protein
MQQWRLMLQARGVLNLAIEAATIAMTGDSRMVVY